MQDFSIPENPSELALLLDILRLRLRALADVLDLTRDDLFQLDADHQALMRAQNSVDIMRAQIAVRERGLVYLLEGGPPPEPHDEISTIPTLADEKDIPGIVPRLRALMTRIAAHPAYSDAMGRELYRLHEDDPGEWSDSPG